MRSHRWRQGTALLMRRELTDEVAGEARGAAKRWQHAGENLEPQVLFIAQPVGTTLNDPDLIVEPFDKSKRYLILRLAVGGDAVPVTVDHLGELLVRLEPLPLEAPSPVLKEAPRPALALVTPQLTEALLEDIGRVQPLVGRQQDLQRLPAVEREVLLARQQRVFLAFDVAPVAARKSSIFALANVIQSFTEMPHDMELVEQNRRLQRMRRRRQPKRLPHVHHCEPNARALLRAEPGVELAHTRLRTVLAAKPDRPAAKQIAHHNPVGVPFADRDLVNADHLR